MDKKIFDIFGLRFTMEMASDMPANENEEALIAEVCDRWINAVTLAVMPWNGTTGLRLVSDGGVRVDALCAPRWAKSRTV